MTGDDRLIEELKKVLTDIEVEGLAVKSRQVHPVFESTNLLVDGINETIITAANTAIELGHPTCTSLCLCMLTERQDLVTDCRVTLFGRELQELPPGRHPFALIVFAEANEASESSRRALLRKILSCRLKGTSVRMSSGKIWIRFSQEALVYPLKLTDLGWLLLSELKEQSGFEKIEIALVVAGEDYIKRLKPVAEGLAEERNLRYKTALVEKMECETGLDCEVCSETETCQVLKDAVPIAKRKQRNRRGEL